MIIGEQTFYVLVSIFAAVTTLFFVVWSRQFEGATRRYMSYGPFLTGVLALGYFAMSTGAITISDPNGRPVPLARFLMYFLTYVSTITAAGIFAGVRRRSALVGSGFMAGFVLGTIINWLATPPFNNVGRLMVVGSMISLLWLFFRPYTRAAGSVSGPRRLAFAKLRNLIALLTLMYFVVGLTSRQGLGLLGTFTGVYLGGYLDLLGHIGFAGILLRSEEAVAQLVTRYSSPLDYFRTETVSETAAPEASAD